MSERDWKRWYDYLPRRLYMLRWYLLHGGKFWMGAGLAARLRGAYWAIVRGHDSEICSDCGRPVQLVFHVPDALWEEATGFARAPSGEAAPGILCPECVNDRVGFLYWTCSRDDAVMTG
jgi:hypothetical protein